MRFIIWIIVAMVLADVSGRLIVLRSHTRFDFVESTNDNTRKLLVYLPGILADGVQSSLLMVDGWRQYGDVLLVSYDGTRYESPKAARAVERRIRQLVSDYGYDTVVYIGSSMGGPLAYDIEMLPGNVAERTKFVLLAAPTGRRYFASPADKASLVPAAWFAGPISNLTTGKLVLNGIFQEPKEDNIEDGVDRDELKQRVKEAKASPFSVYADQIRYMIGHDELIPGSLAGIDGVYIRCGRDDIVAPEAYEPWKAAFGGELPLIESDTTHVGYNEMPEAFNEDFERAFGLIGLSKE